MNKPIGKPNLGLRMFLFPENKKSRHVAAKIYAGITTTAANIEWNNSRQFIATAHQRIKTLELTATQKRTQQQPQSQK